MKFALLGHDPQAIRLARAATRPPHELVWIGQQSPSTAELLALAPDAVVDDSEWEALLAGQIADAVILGRGADETIVRERLRLLAQSAAPVVVSHPVSLDVLLYYEIEMIRAESRGVLRPFVAGGGHPALRAIAAASAGEADLTDPVAGLGPLEQITIQRYLARRDRDTVLCSLADDAFLVAQACGRIVQVTATGGPAGKHSEADLSGTIDSESLAGLGVHLATQSGVAVQWSVLSGGPEDGAAWTLHGAETTATLRTFGHAPWRWEPDRIGEYSPPTTDGRRVFDDAHEALDDLIAASISGDDGAAWRWATRSLEVVDFAQLSLQRGRAMELFDQRPSEASTFKGLMSAVGCGILVVGVLLAVLSGIVGAIFNLPITGAWYVILLVVMVVFLLLQLLPALLFKKPPRDGDSSRA